MQFQLCTFCSYPQHRFSSSHQCHHQSFAIKSVLLPCSIQVDFSIFLLNIPQKLFHRPQGYLRRKGLLHSGGVAGKDVLRALQRNFGGNAELCRDQCDVPKSSCCVKGLSEQMRLFGDAPQLLILRWGLALGVMKVMVKV